jgi:hypothetical protein
MVLMGRPEGNRPLRRPRHRWEEDIEVDFGETGCGTDWAKDRDSWKALVNLVRELGVGKLSSSCATGASSRRAAVPWSQQTATRSRDQGTLWNSLSLSLSLSQPRERRVRGSRNKLVHVCNKGGSWGGAGGGERS